MYSRIQIKGLETSGPEDRLVWEVLLAAGLREQELSQLRWEDVNFERGWLHLHAKPEFGFSLKDAEQRQIPLPNDLMERLTARKKDKPKSRLVFGTPDGKPDGNFLRRFKDVAFAANLNCSRCVNCAGVSCKGSKARLWSVDVTQLPAHCGHPVARTWSVGSDRTEVAGSLGC